MDGFRSSAYIATGEPESRWIVAPCSSFTFHSACRTTSKVTGSMSFLALRWSASLGEMRSFAGGTYPVRTPSKETPASSESFLSGAFIELGKQGQSLFLVLRLLRLRREFERAAVLDRRLGLLRRRRGGRPGGRGRGCRPPCRLRRAGRRRPAPAPGKE